MQAVDLLWAAQFSGSEDGHGTPLEERRLDWRGFINQLAQFAHEHRAPTPCCLQGRKRQYDMLQRTMPLTGGRLDSVELHQPHQDANDTVTIECDKLVHRHNKLPSMPREAALLTEHYVDIVRSKAARVEHALPERVPKDRMRELLQNRKAVHQDELVDLLCTELDKPGFMQPLAPQEPVYRDRKSVV